MSGQPSSFFAKRARTIPLRLTDEERGMLRVLEGSLTVSEYTDKVDVFSYRANKLARIQEQLGSVFAIISGMLVAAKGKKGQDLVEGRAVSENPELFASIFEVGRRYKIMNPDKLRGNYGKLMFMLQDAQTPEIHESLGFRCVRTILTVRAAALMPGLRHPSSVSLLSLTPRLFHTARAFAAFAGGS